MLSLQRVKPVETVAIPVMAKQWSHSSKQIPNGKLMKTNAWQKSSINSVQQQIGFSLICILH